MSVQAMTRVMESSQTSGMTRLVLLVIANHETEDRGAFPSIHTIGREANCSDRAVQDAIARAKQMGELAVSYRTGPGGTNIYRTLCGTRGAAPLPIQQTRESAGVQNLRGADVRRESAPELKELGSELGSVGSSSEVPDLPAPKNGAVTYGQDFEAFWAVYPLKKDKGHAAAAFKKARRSTSLDELIAGAKRYRDDPGRDPSKTKFAQGWLNGHRWLDEASPTGADAVLAYLERIDR